MDIQGACDPQFHAVRIEVERTCCEATSRRFRLHYPARLVMVPVGSTARFDTSTPWTEDTVSLVFSCTKGATPSVPYPRVARPAGSRRASGGVLAGFAQAGRPPFR